MVEILRSLVTMEDHAALVMLFWGNAALFVLVLSYVVMDKTANFGPNGVFLRKFAVARGIQALGWCCLLVFQAERNRAFLIVGGLLALAGLFAESDALLFITDMPGERKKRLRMASTDLMLVGAVLFSVSRILVGSILSVTFALVSLPILIAGCVIGPVCLAGLSSATIRKFVGISAFCMYAAAVGWAIGGADPFPVSLFRESIAQDIFRIALVILTLSGGTGILILSKEATDRRIAEMAIRDPLTELYNRRHFFERGREEFADCARNGDEVAFVFLDLDGFKKINDKWGHRFGDAVLRDFSALLRLGIRPLDLCCRYGGEEFVIFLPRTGREGAATVAERMLEAVRGSKFPEQLDFSYTVSAGVAHGRPVTADEEAFMDLLAKSDEAMYRAKRAGRDRVVFWEDPPPGSERR